MTQQTQSRPRIAVVGDVMLDHYFHGSATRLSPEAPVPVVHVGRQEPRLGGASNVALNLARLGADVTLCGLIGRDHAGGIIRRIAECSGIHAALTEGNARTIEKIRVLAQSQQIVRVDFEDPFAESDIAAVTQNAADAVANADAVIFSDYAKGTLRYVRDLIGLAKEHGIPALVDPKGSDYLKYSGATAVTPNRSELKAVVGAWQTEEALSAKAHQLREELGLEKLLLTRSEEGMTLYEAEGETHFKAEAREVFDVSGAGDTAIAVLALMLCRGRSWPQAVTVANRAAGIVVGRLGTAALTAEDLLRCE